ncbi:histidine kinase [Brevibacillus sp. SYSU BS000544]|uniref:GAF domain-containing sensor histidine kinase n=1 Tax=Brevibacillus sp. SYSU BS000544 TaxID=3416443 RepID=UPI003CE52BDE
MIRLERKSKKLVLFQLFVVLFCLMTAIVFVGCISEYYDILRAKCILEPCEIQPAPPTTVTELAKINMTIDSYALSFVIIDSAFIFLFYTAALIILLKCFHEPLGLLGALMLVSFGTTFPSLVPLSVTSNPLLSTVHSFIGVTGWITFYLFFFLFPNGQFVPKWTGYVTAFLTISYGMGILFPGTQLDYLEWPITLKGIWIILLAILLIYTQFYRYLKISSPAERQQTKWVVYGVSFAMLGLIGISAFFDPAVVKEPLTYIYLNIALSLGMLTIPSTLTLAILRRRLWDIDPLVNRTLVYSALSISVVAIYTFSVLYLSRLFRTEDNFVISLLATSVVAVIFAPLKERLQRIVNRLMKGRHDDPYAVLTELGNHLVKPMAPEAMLEVVVQTIQDALRLPFVCISIHSNGLQTLTAISGESTDDLSSFPIIQRGEELGTLYVAPRSPGEAFTAEDQKLLDVLLSQAGPIIQNVTMTIGMKNLAQDLQESREKLILAREEERRNIRRNLHDDLAPRLAALALNAATAEKYVKTDPDTATLLLEDLRKVIRFTVEEIRTLVHDLRPPTLDELGLLGAIQERVKDLTKTTQQLAAAQETPYLHIELEAPEQLPVLPAAVEVAAYRIVTESMVNVVRHAQAAQCLVRVEVVKNNQLMLEIIDNGKGISLRPKASGKGGIGLVSIRERAAELGGQCTFERLEQGGTKITAILPF